jgi:hypothetical protein
VHFFYFKDTTTRTLSQLIFFRRAYYNKQHVENFIASLCNEQRITFAFMDYNEKYELVLNHISYGEQVLRNEKDYEDYRQLAYLFLNHKGKHLFEEDILSHFSENMTLEKIFAQSPRQYIQGMNQPNPKKDGKREKTWYDTFDTEFIEPEDDFFDYFFACKLRQVDLLQVDDFLNYHLEKKFGSDTDKFVRFLLIVLRKHKDLLKQDVLDTVSEWSSSLSKTTPSAEQASVKGRMKRTADDGITFLNLEQTALLVHFMQEARMLLKDEYLNNKQAGQAMSMLTGYSSDTLRLEIGSPKKNRKNLTDLYNALIKLSHLIERQIKAS